MKNSDYSINSIPFNLVEITDQFWAPRIEIHRKITIPHVLKKCQSTHRIDNFTIAGGLMEKGKTSKFPFDDSDVFKILEGVANALKIHPDSILEEQLDQIIDKIAAAQENDGYLYTFRAFSSEDAQPWIGKKRWELTSIFSHELYNVGHLYESAAAHHEATGKRKFLNVAIKNADLVERDFGYGKIESPPGHQEIEIGLIRLFRLTGEQKYLDLAKFFLDIRGDKNGKGYQEYVKNSIDKMPWKGEDRFKYNQTHDKVIDQSEAIGHAVRALYMYCAMVDVGVLTNNNAYLAAIDRLWDDLVSKKMYLTGGIGNKTSGEAIGIAYELPNLGAYTETCAAIANVLWNYRLFLLKGDSRYMDVLERTLYNGLLAGYALDGKRFFYTNPLFSDGLQKRNLWYSVACCPSNIARFIPTISGYLYAVNESTLYINLYASSKATVQLNGFSLSVIQETDYPWSGKINVKIGSQEEKEFNLALRIPGWARNVPVPSDLYKYVDNLNQDVTLRVNGENIDYKMQKGYAIITREWKNDDEVELIIPMPIRRIISHENVKENFGKVALERGPLVYCMEWPDNEFHDFKNITLKDTTDLNSQYQEDLLNGLVTINGKVNCEEKGNLNKEYTFKAIPYYAWAHRGMGEMTVWINRK